MRVLIISVIMLLGYCGTLFAWGENLKSIEADFEQYIENDDGTSVYYKGKILGKSPNKVK